MSIRIKVQPRDIQRGRPQEGASCPIALAARRQFHRRVFVDRFLLTVYNPKPKVFVMPLEACRFVDMFDEDGARRVHPFEFEAKELSSVV